MVFAFYLFCANDDEEQRPTRKKTENVMTKAYRQTQKWYDSITQSNVLSREEAVDYLASECETRDVYEEEVQVNDNNNKEIDDERLIDKNEKIIKKKTTSYSGNSYVWE